MKLMSIFLNEDSCVKKLEEQESGFVSTEKFLLTIFLERRAVMKVRSSDTRKVCYNSYNFSFICCTFSKGPDVLTGFFASTQTYFV